MLSLLTVAVDATHTVPLLGVVQSVPAGFVVVNVGGLDRAGATEGPDDAWLFVNNGDDPPSAFLLLSGAALAFPGDLANLYARAVTTTTTLTVALGARQ